VGEARLDCEEALAEPVPGSSAASIIRHRAAVAQLARASACHAEGRGFESLQPLRRKPSKSEGFSFGRSAHEGHLGHFLPVFPPGSKTCKALCMAEKHHGGAAERAPFIGVSLSGGYYFGQLERLITQLEPVMRLESPTRVEIDLGGLAFIGPTALALVLAAAMHAESLGGDLQVYVPRNPLIERYLLRSDFVRHLLHSDAIEEPFKRKAAPGLQPCARFGTFEDSVMVARDLTAALAGRTKLDDASRLAVQACLHELTENVVYHGDTALGGFAAGAYSRRRQEVEIGIVDLGIGIRASLAKNPSYAGIADDRAAVQKAMIPTVSSTPERNSGYGLAWTELMLLANGGSLRIRSGYGAASLGLRRPVPFEEKDVYLPGTLVCIRARTDRPLDTTEAWRLLDDAIERLKLKRTPASDFEAG
jgi:hypothetical protein